MHDFQCPNTHNDRFCTDGPIGLSEYSQLVRLDDSRRVRFQPPLRFDRAAGGKAALAAALPPQYSAERAPAYSEKTPLL